MELEDTEAESLARALANVQRHYPNVRVMSDKHMALGALMVCAGRIYGKRATALIAKPSTPQQRQVAPTPRPAAQPTQGEPEPSWFAPPTEHMQ